MRSVFLVLVLSCCVSASDCFCSPGPPLLRRVATVRAGGLPRSSKRTAGEIWQLLESARETRERIKEDILYVIRRQRECEEGSQSYLALERKFMELLEKEDEVVLRISGLVQEMIASKRLGKNVASFYKAYFREC